MIGPFTIDIKIHVQSEKEGTIGSVTYGLSPGRVPTREDFIRGIGAALAALPDGYSLLNGDDFFNKVLVKEKTGRVGNFAVPGDCCYDVDALHDEAWAAFQKPQPKVAKGKKGKTA